MIGEFEGRCPGATLCAINDDEIGIDFGFQHRLANGEEFPGMSDTKLEAGGFAAGKISHPAYKMHHVDRRRERGMPRWRNTVDVHRYAARSGDFRIDLCRREYAAMAWLGALAKLQFDHFHLFALCRLFEFLGAKSAVRIAAAEVSGSDLPNNVAAVFSMIGTVTAFTGVVSKIAFFSSTIEGANRVRA